MPRCQRHHLKRLTAPSHWMLAKSAGKFAVKPSTGPHKERECLPIHVFLRDRLKLAIKSREVIAIVKKRLVKVDGKVRTDPRYPTGLMDVIEFEKAHIFYRIVYDSKGRFVPVKIDKDEATFKLLRVNQFKIGAKAIPTVVTHDGRTIRCVDPSVRLHTTLKFDLRDHDVKDFYPFELGKMAIVTSGSNRGRVGLVCQIESGGSINIVKLKDGENQEFSTRQANVFIIGDSKSLIKLPAGEGVRQSIAMKIEELNEQAQ